MDKKFPDLNKTTTTEAIEWYSHHVSEVFSVDNLLNGTYSEAYKEELYHWKQELNKKIAHEDNQYEWMKGVY